MRIGLIDVDGRHFPNIALMKISAYHKAHGDTVDVWPFMGHYDKVYRSKVFPFSPDFETLIDADEIIRGGTGFMIFDELPECIDRMTPDYSIYPNQTVTVAKKEEPFALGFLTRGCIKNCPWCIVPRKEGAIRPYMTWQ